MESSSLSSPQNKTRKNWINNNVTSIHDHHEYYACSLWGIILDNRGCTITTCILYLQCSRISYNTCYNSVAVIISLKCDLSFPYSFLDLLFITLFIPVKIYLYYVASEASVNKCLYHCIHLRPHDQGLGPSHVNKSRNKTTEQNLGTKSRNKTS
jgi:hypothetical protein